MTEIELTYVVFLISFLFFHKKQWFSYIILAFIVVVIGANTLNCDLDYRTGNTDVYYSLYSSSELFSTDIGYGLLMNLFKTIGVSYKYFRLICAVILFYLYNKFVRKYSHCIALVYLLYIIYPFIYDVVAQRNTFGMFIWIFSLQYLIDGSKDGRIKYMIGNLIAGSMQITLFVYLPFVLLNPNKTFQYNDSILKINMKNTILNKKIRYGLFFIILISIIIGISPNLLETFMKYIGKVIFGEERRSEYFGNITKYYWMLLWAEQFFSFALVYFISNKLIKTEDDENKTKFYVLTYLINLYAFVFLPFYVLSGQFFRLGKNIIPLNIIVYSNYWKSHPYSLLFPIIIVYQIFMFFMHIYLGGNWFIPIYDPIVENNWIYEIGLKPIE